MKLSKQKRVLNLLTEGRYRIGSGGVLWSNHHSKGQWRPIRFATVRNGYQQKVFYNKGSALYVYAHQLVWLACKGLFDQTKTLNHIDFDVTNNALYNLELLSLSENIRKSVAAGRWKSPTTKLSMKEVLRMRLLSTLGVPTKRIARLFNISASNARAIVQGRTWKEVA
jgi:hypothetical protein